jgi:DNA polymerase III alpha subunit
MDIDIDLKTNFDPRKIFANAIPASRVNEDELVKHPCGVYFQTIPVDPITELAAIPYEEAEVMGYFKIDFLHLSALDHFNSKDEIRALIAKQPDWTLLLNEEHVSKMFQINKRADLLAKVRPTSVQELADCIALIRPGKKHLLEQYLRNKEQTRKELYKKTEDGYSFKRSHAISYALTIVLQLHLIEQGKL